MKDGGCHVRVHRSAWQKLALSIKGTDLKMPACIFCSYPLYFLLNHFYLQFWISYFLCMQPMLHPPQLIGAFLSVPTSSNPNHLFQVVAVVVGAAVAIVKPECTTDIKQRRPTILIQGTPHQVIYFLLKFPQSFWNCIRPPDANCMILTGQNPIILEEWNLKFWISPNPSFNCRVDIFVMNCSVTSLWCTLFFIFCHVQLLFQVHHELSAGLAM